MTGAVIIYAGPVARTVGVDFPPVVLPSATPVAPTSRRVTLFLAHSEVSHDP